MLKNLLIILAVIGLFACGKEVQKTVEYIDSPTGCEPIQVEEGLVWKCIDKDGNEKTGLVKHGKDGKQGASGPKGIDGESGPKGDGLQVVKQYACMGAVEGWLENSTYELAIKIYRFETDDIFISYRSDLMRDGTILNHRDSSPFFRSTDHEIKWSDGVFLLDFQEDHVLVKMKSTEDESKIECKEGE